MSTKQYNPEEISLNMAERPEIQVVVKQTQPRVNNIPFR